MGAPAKYRRVEFALNKKQLYVHLELMMTPKKSMTARMAQSASGGASTFRLRRWIAFHRGCISATIQSAASLVPP